MNKYLALTLFFIVHISMYFYVYPVKIIEAAPKGQWEPVAVGFLVELLFMCMYLKGLSAYPGQDIVDICRGVSGKWMTRVILFPFIVFLFVSFNLIHRYEFESVSALLLPKTPMVFILLLYAIPFYAGWKGIEAVSRGAVTLFICVLPLILFSLISGYNNFDFNNIYPLLDTRMTFVRRPEFYASLFAHAGFLFLGFVQLKQKLLLRHVVAVLGILFIFGIASVYLPMLIFGQESIVYFRYPNVLTSDTVDNEWVVFDWLPTFFVISMIAVSMAEGALSLWMLSRLVQKLFMPERRGLAVIMLGVLSYGFSVVISNIDRLELLVSWNTLFCLYSIGIIPLIVWMMSLRHRRSPA